LIACAYKRPDCALGVILGTGTNASYLEDPELVAQTSDFGLRKNTIKVFFAG